MFCSLRVWTNTARRCSRQRRVKALHLSHWLTEPPRNLKRWVSNSMLAPTTSCAPRQNATKRPLLKCGNAWKRTAIFICRNMRVGIRCVMKLITTKTKPRSARAGGFQSKPQHWLNGWKKKAISSASRLMKSHCLIITKPILISLCRINIAAKLFPLLSAA